MGLSLLLDALYFHKLNIWSCVSFLILFSPQTVQSISQGVAITVARYLENEEHLLPQPR